MSSDVRTKPRWWPLVAIWIMSVAGIIAAMALNDANRQSGVMTALGIVGLGVFLSVLWLLFFSKLRWKLRFATLAVGLVLAFVLGNLFRYEGVSGDFEPIFRWRWTDSGDAIQAGLFDEGKMINGAFPQFLGPERNARITGSALDPAWAERPPKLLWKRPIGEAWSGFAIQGRRGVTQEQEGLYERVVQYDILTGDVLWERRIEARYDNPLGGVGPRATPAISEGRVYALGGLGNLACLDFETGKEIWEIDLLEEHNASLPDWGMAGSPLAHGDRVIVNVGGTESRMLVAYDKRSGEFVWSGGSDKAHWSSPVVYRIADQAQCLIFNKSGLSSHDIDTGEVLWQYPWTKSTGTPRVAIPVLLPNDRIVISSGYGAGAAAIRISKSDDGYQIEELWQSLHLKSKFNNFVYRDGYLYGLDDGMMTCIDAETGRRTWKKGRYGHGQLLHGEDWLLLMSEGGEAMLFEPNPEEPRILGKFQALKGKSWNPPALVGPYLILRNHLEAACYQLPIRID
jgi:outer membrane protein assembly factor BamB